MVLIFNPKTSIRPCSRSVHEPTNPYHEFGRRCPRVASIPPSLQPTMRRCSPEPQFWGTNSAGFSGKPKTRNSAVPVDDICHYADVHQLTFSFRDHSADSQGHSTRQYRTRSVNACCITCEKGNNDMELSSLPNLARVGAGRPTAHLRLFPSVRVNKLL